MFPSSVSKTPQERPPPNVSWPRVRRSHISKRAAVTRSLCQSVGGVGGANGCTAEGPGRSVDNGALAQHPAGGGRSEGRSGFLPRRYVEIELGLTANSHGCQEPGWPRRAAAGTPGRGLGQKSDRAAAKPP